MSLTIKITMPQTDWDAVRTEQPAGCVCKLPMIGGQPGYPRGERQLSGRDIWKRAFQRRPTMFTQVGVKKKSFCGSINSDKPCLAH